MRRIIGGVLIIAACFNGCNGDSTNGVIALAVLGIAFIVWGQKRNKY